MRFVLHRGLILKSGHVFDYQIYSKGDRQCQQGIEVKHFCTIFLAREL